jgi:hypothetical protein
MLWRMMQIVSPGMFVWYSDPDRDRSRDGAHARRLDFRGRNTDSWSVDVLEELIAEAKAANAAMAAYKQHIGRVRELLPVVRVEKPELTVVQIEEKIGRAYDRGTISRLTAEAAGKARKKD